MNFTPKRASESEIFTVDFAPLLSVGEAIDTPVWTITTVDGHDAAVSAMVVGQASISGTTSSQMISRGLPGVRYAPVCTVHTSQGQVLVLPEFGDGQLEITL